MCYTVVGDGDDRGRLENRARELGVERRVEFRGSLGQKELLEAYRRADLFVLASRASRSDVEGFGIVYLEAAASGVPSLCSREGGATDAVVDGRTDPDRQLRPAGDHRRNPELFGPPGRIRRGGAKASPSLCWPRISAELRAQLAARL